MVFGLIILQCQDQPVLYIDVTFVTVIEDESDPLVVLNDGLAKQLVDEARVKVMRYFMDNPILVMFAKDANCPLC